MRTFTLLVFDSIISGTATPWYSREGLYRAVGEADAFAVQACTTDIGGAFPALTVASEHSSDGQYWAPTNHVEINNVGMTEGGCYAGTSGWLLVVAAHVRFKITLGGTSPRCRLKLYVTGRGSPGSSLPAADRGRRIQPAQPSAR